MEWSIGIDPGINFTGLAVLRRGVVEKVDLIKRRSDDLESNIYAQCMMYTRTLDEFFRRFGMLGTGVHRTIEVPRNRPGSPVRVEDILNLSLLAGALAGCGPVYMTALVTPKQWKGDTPKPVHNVRVLEQMPELSGMLKPWPRGQHEHMIDAVGIAKWRYDQR